MKNLCFLIALTLCATLSMRAQTKKSDPVVVNVTYQLVHVNNLNEKDKPFKKDMVLSVGKNSSRYITAEVYNRVMTPVQIPTAGTKIYSGKPIVMVTKNGAVVQENVFQYPLSNTMNITAVLGNNSYMVETTLPKINWKTEAETKQIGGFICQKAIGEFAGRRYTAWFAPDLPFQSGPFKLWGLPGLILEAEDSRQEVRFLFKDINRETDAKKAVVSLGSPPIKISVEAYNKAKKMYQANPDGYMQGQLGANAPKVAKAYENEADKNVSKKVLANPIEF